MKNNFAMLQIFGKKKKGGHVHNAVLTISIGNRHNQVGKLTIPLMKQYAEKIGAAFELVDSEKLKLGKPHYEKFQIFEFLDRYDRILYLDDDVIIKPDCPDLFGVVPSECFGAFLVHNFSKYHDASINLIQESMGQIGWSREYFNSGVMIVSKSHKEVFRLNEYSALGEKYFFDQTQINYNVQKLQVPFFDIGYRYNHTTAPGKNYDRFKSFIIHYPGEGHRKGSKLEQIYLDMKHLGLTRSLPPFVEPLTIATIARRKIGSYFSGVYR